jgi:cytochrome c2
VREIRVLWGDPHKGAQVLSEKGCLSCHSVKGVGGKLAADLAERPRIQRTFTELAAIMWNHAPEMQELARKQKVAWKPFAGSEMRDFLSYLYLLGALDDRGNATRGKRLFVEKGCASCHALREGESPALGPPLSQRRRFVSPIPWAEAVWGHAARMEEMTQRLGLPWPTFTGTEMVDLFTYIHQAAQRKRRGGRRG